METESRWAFASGRGLVRMRTRGSSRGDENVQKLIVTIASLFCKCTTSPPLQKKPVELYVKWVTFMAQKLYVNKAVQNQTKQSLNQIIFQEAVWKWVKGWPDSLKGRFSTLVVTWRGTIRTVFFFPKLCPQVIWK